MTSWLKNELTFPVPSRHRLCLQAFFHRPRIKRQQVCRHQISILKVLPKLLLRGCMSMLSMDRWKWLDHHVCVECCMHLLHQWKISELAGMEVDFLCQLANVAFSIALARSARHFCGKELYRRRCWWSLFLQGSPIQVSCQSDRRSKCSGIEQNLQWSSWLDHLLQSWQGLGPDWSTHQLVQTRRWSSSGRDGMRRRWNS